MWTPEDFPGADKVPWQLLIRARFVYEVDAIIASRITHALAGVLPAKAAGDFGRRASRAVSAAPRDEVARDRAAGALIAYADFDEICPRWWRWPFPGPRPHWDELGEFGDPLAVVVIDRAQTLLELAASDEVRKELGVALDELASTLEG